MREHEFIEAEKARYTVQELCDNLGVARSAYYDWERREPSARAFENRRLATRIRAIHLQHKGRYGSPRICAQLRADGMCIGENRVARIMRVEGIVAKPKRRFRRTTDSSHKHPCAPNLLNRDFQVNDIDTVWVGDITYIWTSEGWTYLAVLWPCPDLVDT